MTTLLVRPSSLISARLSREAETLIWIADQAPERSLSPAESMPDIERAIVLLHAADALVFLRTPDGNPASSSGEALSEARKLYERIDRLAQSRAPARWRVVGAVALYGCALVDIAQRNLWDAALQLRRAASRLCDISGYCLLVDDLIIEGFDSRRTRRVIEELRDRVLRRVKVSVALQEA